MCIKLMKIAVNKWSEDIMSITTIETILKRRKLLTQSRHCLLWAAINGVSATLVAIDFKYSIVGSLLDSDIFYNFVLILDLIIGLILILNVFYDFGLWFWKRYLMTEIELTSSQMKAFGVKADEIGFKLLKETISSPNDSKLDQSFGSVSPAFEMSYTSDFEGHSSLNSTHLSIANTTGLSNSFNDSPLNSTATSWEYNPSSSPFNSTDQMNDSRSGFIRLRRNPNKVNYIQPIVTNERQLNEYLKQFERKEQRFEEIADSEKRNQTTSPSTPWNCSPINQMSGQEETNQINYQIAIDSPLRLNDSDFESPITSTTSKALDSLITKLKINEILMNQWIENIRKWISQTIICRLVEQINKTNESLAKSGHFDALIGETSLQSLKQLCALKKPEFSSLDNILPFLDITTNQEYFVQRLRDLSRGGCIGKFVWNSGGSYNLKPWTEQMPTDSAIVMHLFRTYMDLRLPSDPNSPDGKAFTNFYFKSMTGMAPKSTTYILEVKNIPPHYKVFTEEEGVWDLPIGRNNLFHATLVFLDAIKSKQLGHLGRINLGSSGLNILWVIQR